MHRHLPRALLTALVLLGCTKDVPAPSGDRTPVPVVTPTERQTAKAFEVEAWTGASPTTLASLRGCVVMVRFWTNTCPFCRRSMPVIQELSEELEGKPIRFIGLYHPKPKGREGTWEEAVSVAKTWGITFPIGYDRNWKTLEAWWLKDNARSATSVSFILDPRGDIAHVHPGPELSSSKDAGKPYTDLLAVKSAITAALVEAPGC